MTPFPLKHSGFTLLELMIALFIFTIVSFIMVGALHQVLQTESSLEKASLRFTALERTIMMMKNDFEQAINRSIFNAKGIKEFAWIGSPTTVTFSRGGMANVFSEFPASSLERVAYVQDHQKLIRKTWPVIDQSSKTLPDERVLLTNISAIQFSYLDNHGIFQNNWPPENQEGQLPAAIRIEMNLKDWGKLSQLYLMPGYKIVKPS